jgi:hypothetical protein
VPLPSTVTFRLKHHIVVVDRQVRSSFDAFHSGFRRPDLENGVFFFLKQGNEVRMIPIEQTSVGMLVFLKCGCNGLRGMMHPTGAAFLVTHVQPCDHHAEYDEPIDGVRVRSIPKGELVSPYVRTLVTPESLVSR